MLIQQQLKNNLNITMPYKSDAQRKFMHAVHPDIVAKWDKKYETSKDLPDKVNPNKTIKIKLTIGSGKRG